MDDLIALGHPLGWALLGHGSDRLRVTAFGTACYNTLGVDDGRLYLELFDPPSGELVFVDIGLRPGAKIAFLRRG